MTVVKLTTQAACRVVGLHRDRFNEHVASGNYSCAPPTVPGRARLFDPGDMLTLRLFRDLMDDGFDARRAGSIACSVGQAANQMPEASVISYVELFNLGTSSVSATEVPDAKDWGSKLFSGAKIRKVTTFAIGALRELISQDIEEERSIIGEPDSEAEAVSVARERFQKGLITRDEFAEIALNSTANRG